MKNGDETDIDCGGSCSACAYGKSCLHDGDCLSGYCDYGNICFDLPDSSSMTIYIDDNIADDPENHKWNTIQKGINDANEGDIILVKDGIYTENVKVNKSHIIVKSENGNEKTIVKAKNVNDFIFDVTADYIEINGFTIKGGRGPYTSYGGIRLINTDFCNITNNYISHNSYGIRLTYAGRNNIYFNNFIDNIHNIGSSYSTTNIWNSPEPITYTYNGNTFTNYIGNYWDGYTDIDTNGDGIWDNPYNIDSDNQDNYPLKDPFENYETETTTLTCTLSANPTTGNAPLPVTFSMSANDQNNSIISWSLDTNADGTPEYSGTGYPPSTEQHTYINPDTYTAKLTVTNSNGKKGYSEETITVTDQQKSTTFKGGDDIKITSEDGWNIRSEPKLDDEYILVPPSPLPKNSEGQIQDHEDNGIPIDGYYWWYVKFGNYNGWCAEDGLDKFVPSQPISCAIELQKNGAKIDNIDIGKFFDIVFTDYIGNIDKVKFLSDENQNNEVDDGFHWDVGHDWTTSSPSSDWNATTKIRTWTFLSSGIKEVWAEINDSKGQTANCSADIIANGVNSPSNTKQFRSNGLNEISQGEAIADNTVIFKETVSNQDGYKVKLQVELRHLDEYGGNFDETQGGLKESNLVSDGNEVSIIINDLIDGNYHWRARTVDEHGMMSDWVEFGNNPTSDADFIVIKNIKKRIIAESLNMRWNYLHMDMPIGMLPWDYNTYVGYFNDAVNYRTIAVTSLAYAINSAKSGDFEKAELYLDASHQSNINSRTMYLNSFYYYQSLISKSMFVAEKVKDVCFFAVSVGVNVYSPGAGYLVDGLFILVDLKIDTELYGSDTARKNAVTKVIIQTIFKNVKITEFGGKTMEETIQNMRGDKIIPLVNNLFTSEQGKYYMYEAIKDAAILELSEEGAQLLGNKIIEEFPIFVNPGLIFIKAKSPVELRVYDSKGNVTGLMNGEINENIPNSIYDEDSKTVILLIANDDYRYQLKGTAIGTYGLDLVYAKGYESYIISIDNISISSNEIHDYTIDWNNFANEKAISRKVDSNGDGIPEETSIMILPTASFDYSPINPIGTKNITFNASASYDPDGFINNYRWNFGDGNITTTTDKIITHFYSSTGKYNITLTVTDNDNAKNHIQKQITITEQYCGDNICNNEETCATCPEDCGACIDTTVFGTVYNNAGIPAENADVTVTCNPNTPYETSISTTTDEDGAYTADMTTCTDGSPLLITAQKNNYLGQTTGTMDYYSMNIYDITLSGTEIPVFPLQILAPLLTILSIAIVRPKL